jgi:hypothetical protein
LLRNGIRYEGKSSLIPMHLRWLTELGTAATGLTDCLSEISRYGLDRFGVGRTTRSAAPGTCEILAIKAMQSLRGVQLTTV